MLRTSRTCCSIVCRSFWSGSEASLKRVIRCLRRSVRGKSVSSLENDYEQDCRWAYERCWVSQSFDMRYREITSPGGNIHLPVKDYQVTIVKNMHWYSQEDIVASESAFESRHTMRKTRYWSENTVQYIWLYLHLPRVNNQKLIVITKT